MHELTPRSATRDHLPAIRALWRTCFGDGEDLIELSLAHIPAERFVVLARGDAVLSMTAALPCGEIVDEGCAPRGKIAYLYAVATAPAHRGAGYAGALLGHALAVARARGEHAAWLTPASPALFDYYGKRGFARCSPEYALDADLEDIEAGPGARFSRLAAADYGRLREELLRGRAHIRYAQDFLRFQEALATAGGGGLYAAEWGRAPAACLLQAGADGALEARDVLAPAPIHASAFKECARARGLRRLSVRAQLPFDGAAPVESAMCAPPLPALYAGLALN